MPRRTAAHSSFPRAYPRAISPREIGSGASAMKSLSVLSLHGQRNPAESMNKSHVAKIRYQRRQQAGRAVSTWPIDEKRASQDEPARNAACLHLQTFIRQIDRFKPQPRVG